MKRTIKVLLLLLCFVFASTPLMAAMSFYDVKTSDWFYDEVNFVTSNGIFQGMSRTEFAPNEPMTRAMFVTVLGRMAGINANQYGISSKFGDVADNEWYTPYVSWAEQTGITSGMSDTYFGTNQPITREQLAKFIIQYLNYKNINPIQVCPIYDFDDVDDIASWALYYVNQCHKFGILQGREWNYFDPQDTCTRAEVATVAHRLCEIANGEHPVVNYASMPIPSYDSVTLDFCILAGDYYGDYYEDNYWPWADTMVYKYNAKNLSLYLSHLSDAGFRHTKKNVEADSTTWLYEKDHYNVLIGAPVTIYNAKFTVVFISVDDDYLGGMCP